MKKPCCFLPRLRRIRHYHQNPYTVYSGGDHRLQIIRNNLNPKGKKMLIIRDSFACSVTPFLSLQAGELHLCDMRDFLKGEKMNLASYIEQLKPDYVMILFAGSNTIDSDGRYDFFSGSWSRSEPIALFIEQVPVTCSMRYSV